MPRRSVAVALGACALLPILAAPLLAQQKPTFRSGVEVVLIDVNVVDPSHAPVSALKPEDFVVSVDHKPRKVVSAEFVRYDVRTSTTTGRQTVPMPAGVATAKAAERPPARNVLIVIDNDSMEPGDGLLARQEAAKFIDKLAPDDRIGVVTIPRMQSVVTMTKIRAEARAELAKVITGSERYRPMQFNIGVAEAFDVERGDGEVARKIIQRECTPGYNGCAEDVKMEIRQIQLEAHMRGVRSFEALRDLGLSLSRIEGPKTMLYLTGGAPPADLKSATAYSQVGSAFAAAQVTLYTLYIHQELLHQVKDRQSPTAIRDMDIEREGVENATGAANGTFMQVVGTFDLYFDRILTELAGAYVIGIEVQSADRDGRPHQVSVKVNRKGVEVRARKQYVIEPATTGAAGTASPAGVSASVPRPRAFPVPLSPARDIETTPADTQPLVERMGQYVQSYVGAFLALLSEERAELRLSKWVVQSGKGGWLLENQRKVAAENLLVRRPGAVGWTALRDVFEVNGKATRDRDGRLRAMFLEAPDTIIERAAAMTRASAAHDIGFADRSANAATSPLVFLDAGNQAHFVFVKQAEQVVGGVQASQVAFAEHG